MREKMDEFKCPKCGGYDLKFTDENHPQETIYVVFRYHECRDCMTKIRKTYLLEFKDIDVMDEG